MILRPFVIECESYLKDSQHLLQETLELFIPEDYDLISGDFDSLYNNIVLEEALDLICEFIKDKFVSIHINIFAFREILKIVFNFNIFKYKNTFYKQIKGIAMGSKCGVSVANIFLYVFERSFLQIHKPSILFYKRYIDDIFIILRKNFEIGLLLNSFGSLMLNIVCESTINFLDLLIYVCKISKKIKIQTFY